MTHTSFRTLAAAWLLGLGALLGTAAAADTVEALATAGSDGRQGTFKLVEGEVTVTRGSVHSAAIVGAGVLPGDRIVTGKASAAALTLRDGSSLSIGPNSDMDLSELAFNSTTHEGNMAVRLTRGTLRVLTGLIAKLKPEQVKITTPTSVIGVRGTDFIVEVNQ